MPTLVITVGIQGSGKSYFVDNTFKDIPGYLLTGNDRDGFNETRNKVHEALRNLKSIVIDNIHLEAKSRAELIEKFKDTHEIECHYFFSNNEISWQRVKERKNNKISKAMILNSLNSLEPPHKGEGYTKLYFHDEFFNVHEI